MNAMVNTGLGISPIITDRFPASRWEDAFAVARAGNGGKVIIDWTKE
jgi:threonine 3-dehydrogenase